VILCGFCKAPISKQVEIEGAPREWGCASCGNWDSKDEISKIAFDYAGAEMQIQTHKIAQSAAEKSGIMRFFGKTTHDRMNRAGFAGG